MGLLAVGVLLAAALAEWSRRREQRTQARLCELEARLGELQAFAGRVAHDLRGPLTPIVINSQIIERSGVPDPVRRLAERIEGSAGRLADMIDMMLSFARLVGSRPRGRCELGRGAVDIVAAWRLRAAAVGATIVTSLEDELWVACEPEIVGSAVQNLLDNAIKYGLDGDVNRIEVRVRRAGDDALLEVEDHGRGIPSDVLPHVFEPLFRGTDRGEGLGLGLAIVKRLVEARAGRIVVGRGSAGGARFVVELPLASPPRMVSAPEAPSLGAH
jgi:signal transduction histidine kinase